MALIIRLRQQGRCNRQFFRLVATDAKTPRDGKYLEKLGWYNPQAEAGKDLFIDAEKVRRWLAVGATLSENVCSLLARSFPEVLKELEQKRQKKVQKKRLQGKKGKQTKAT